MTTMDAPSVLTMPKAREVWEWVKMDRWVAMVALVCGAAVLIYVVHTLGEVVQSGGDVTVFGLAIAGVITAAVSAYGKIRSAKISNGNGSSGTTE